MSHTVGEYALDAGTSGEDLMGQMSRHCPEFPVLRQINNERSLTRRR